MNDPLDIKKYIRTVKNFPIDGIKFRDITSLIEMPGTFVKTCKELTRITAKFDATMIASIESRGLRISRIIFRQVGSIDGYRAGSSNVILKSHSIGRAA